jgi:hypothetical protein
LHKIWANSNRRIYYGGCVFEGATYRLFPFSLSSYFSVWDTVLLNSDVTPLPIGRIISMWEQAKKKRLTIEWFYRGEDVKRACQDVTAKGSTTEPPAKVGGLELYLQERGERKTPLIWNETSKRQSNT